MAEQLDTTIYRTFVAGKMNQDVDERLLPDGEYRDALNVTLDTSSGSNIGALQNSLGNTLKIDINNILSATPVDAKTIGAVAYEAKNLIYWFVTATNLDAIIEYNVSTGQSARVLECTNGTLNFNSQYIITGVNYLEGGNGNTYLFWTDNYNPPRRINIGRCKSYGLNDPRINIDIDVVLRPPLNAPYILLSKDSSPTSNNMEEKFLYFSYRYKYVDNEYSSMAPFSAVAFQAGAFSIDFETGDNKGMVNEFNKADITFETGNEFVKEIQLLMRDTRSLNVMIIDSFNKSDLFIPSNNTYSFTFRNNKTYTPLSNDQVTRLFDNVPLKAKAQDLIGNRLIYGNYLQFRNIASSDGAGINIDYTVGFAVSSSGINPQYPKQTFRSDRDYEVGIVYGDDYGRLTTVLTTNRSNANNSLSSSVYIPPSASDTANSLTVNIKNVPPAWATNYRLVIKQAKQTYYNIFPRGYLSNGPFRYFLINESDRDKFKVGDYLIFKTANGGATHINKQFKILEFELKTAGFITNAIDGLYFKIKITSSDTFLPPSSSVITTVTSQGTNSTVGVSGVCLANKRKSVPVASNVVTESWIDFPIFYGNSTSNQNAISTVFNTSGVATNRFYYGFNDLRYTIEIQPGNKFRYTVDLYGSSNWIEENIPIVLNGVNAIKLPAGQLGSNTSNLSISFYIKWISTSLAPLDRFKINCRSKNGDNYFTGPSNNTGLLDNDHSKNGGFAILNGNFNDPIYAGASINIKLIEDRFNPNADTTTTYSFIAPQTYKNIEEWFIESYAFADFNQKNKNGTFVKSKGIWFRNINTQISPKVSYPYPAGSNGEFTNTTNITKYGLGVSMFIRGFGDKDGCKQNVVIFNFQISQTPTGKIVVCETVAKENDADIYHELSNTYPIINGKHISRWQYDSKSSTSLGTKLTQSLKKYPHYFTVGETIYIKSVGISSTTPYVITNIPNRYEVIVSLGYPGGPTVPGSIAYTVAEQDQTSVTNGALIYINHPESKNSNYNAFCFGTGLESYRIKDDYANATMEYSTRVLTVIEDYKQESKFASVSYSGLYSGSSSINRLNEFNLSLANFKNLDKEYGPVQKMYARDTDLLVFHQDKVTSVLYGKNLLVDALGGGQVASIPEVLGNQIAYPGEYGISSNPESMAIWSNDIYFTDAKRGVVLKLTGDQLEEISANGMKDYFRDLMRDNPNKQKLGAYDPYNRAYVLSVNETSTLPCELSITPTRRLMTSGTGGLSAFLFAIESNQPSWTISVQDNGFGTNWVNLTTLSGSYNQLIYANVAGNVNNLPRSVNFVVTYCGGTKVFTLNQGTISPVSVTPVII
jgi:hypothetical protein